MKRFVVVVPLLAFASACGHAECRADAAQLRPRLVELYTSEGCSSCPPADAWLRRAPTSRIAALEFHVDYWDSLGWRDRFAQPRFTARQQAQAARDGGGAIYTPQVVLDGRSWQGWYRDALPDPVAAQASMKVSLTDGDPLRVHVETQLAAVEGADAFRNYVALAQGDLSSQVRAGENRGALLRHDHVVRAFAGPLPLASAQADLNLPRDLDRTRAEVVVFAQRPADGAVAQVVVCDL